MKNFIKIILNVIFAFLILTACNNNKTQEKKVSKTLNVYNWSGIIGENTISDFEKRYGVKVRYDNYSSNEELYAKIQTGASGYDVIFPSDYMIDIMSKQGMLYKLNYKNIPNFKNIGSQFKNLYFDPKNQYSVPYQFTTAGLGIDTSKVKNYSESWDLLFDKKYKGRISMLDDIRYGIAPALIKLGYSVNTTQKNELQKALDLMLSQKPLVKVYSSDTYIDLLKSGEVWISYAYSPDVFQIAKENKNIVYVIPREGTTIAIEGMCIPKNAPHKYTAELFINYILEPKVHAAITNFTWSGNPNVAAYPYIDKKILNNKSVFLTDSLYNKCQFIRDVGNATPMYDQIWSELKSK